MSDAGLLAVPAHVAALETAGEFANMGRATLYYPGCGEDESPSHTELFGDSAIYVDIYEEAIRLHREAGHQAFLANAGEFVPATQPDFVAFFNPSGVYVEGAIRASGLKKGGFMGVTSWDLDKIPRYLQNEEAGLAIRAIIRDNLIDEKVEDYLPLESDEELMSRFPERYEKLVEELERGGISRTEIENIGLIETIRQTEEWAEEELERSGYLNYPLNGFDLEVPTRKTLGYGFFLAEKID